MNGLVKLHPGSQEPEAENAIEKHVNSIHIPDLWHIAMRLEHPQQELALQVWHLAHDLRDHIHKYQDQ